MEVIVTFIITLAYFCFTLPIRTSGSEYKIGVGIADITGPPVEIAFMGYAKMEQRGEGLHLRQFSRAFIVDDGFERLVFVTADCGMIGIGVRNAVLSQLSQKFRELYSERNVMISGTHTHSAPGGFLMHVIFDLNTLGFVPETFKALVKGIVLSIERAHSRLKKGKLFIARGEVTGASVNRSPHAYLENPPEERARYKDNVDKMLIQLQLEEENGKPMGVICWFAVHPVSMNNTNTLISSDNMGYASVLFEKKMNPDDLVGKGEFVAGFASSNLGDVSPNVDGPRCQFSGTPCDDLTSSCPERDERCVSKGPGNDMFESTRIIAEKIFNTAWDTWNDDREEIKGSIRVLHQYADMSQMTATVADKKSGAKIKVQGCQPAMGYSFAAGTTDGPGAFSFKQAMKATNPFWNIIRNFIAGPSSDQVECQGIKPILLATGEMNFPLEWQPAIVSTQLAFIGPIIIACVPGEFTTMAGRRLRRVLQEAVGLASEEQVIIAGLCNTYSDYITTPEEYNLQRYEGASTIYGPHTLSLYLEHYKNMAISSLQRAELQRGPQPPELLNDLFSFIPPVLFDTPVWQHYYGDVLEQPPPTVHPGETVKVVFVSGHPRNNLQHEGSYLTVERRIGEDWKVIATDADWETRFIWERSSFILGSSQARIEWTVPKDTPPGEYRIRHLGHHKYFYGQIEPYEGVSNIFKIFS
ncbi:neutral ceramidase isoform X2 [Lycorma delicatula]|uniref:neutral ceramidase isoform X2 n=1 Tax=Lycorma delicatula TaxID=130591 RepID=UPI003F50F326